MIKIMFCEIPFCLCHWFCKKKRFLQWNQTELDPKQRSEHKQWLRWRNHEWPVWNQTNWIVFHSYDTNFLCEEMASSDPFPLHFPPSNSFFSLFFLCFCCYFLMSTPSFFNPTHIYIRGKVCMTRHHILCYNQTLVTDRYFRKQTQCFHGRKILCLCFSTCFSKMVLTFFFCIFKTTNFFLFI